MTVEVNKNGTKKIGFNINGIPKISGSEIPKNEGMIPTFPTVFNCFDLERTNKIASAKHEPHPPMATK